MCDSLNQSVVSQNTQRRCVFVSSSGFTNKRWPGLTNVSPSFSISYTQVDKGWSSGFPLTRVLTSSTAHTILVSPHSYFSQSLMSYLQENFTNKSSVHGFTCQAQQQESQMASGNFGGYSVHGHGIINNNNASNH